MFSCYYIKDNIYNNFIEYAVKNSKTLKMVLYDYCSLDIVYLLEKYLIKKERTGNLPGYTTSTSDNLNLPIVYEFESNESIISILQNYTNSLKNWVCPLAEDLSFYDENNDPWFISITHEDMCYFPKKDEDIINICNNIENLIYTGRFKTCTDKIIDYINKNNLSNFNLYNDEISKLPENFGTMKSLKYIHMTVNNLEELPKSIGNLINLEELTIRCHNLKSIPKEIGLLSNLTILKIKSHYLDSIPKEIGSLLNLKVFELDGGKHCAIEQQPEYYEKNSTNNSYFNSYYTIPSKLKILPEELGNLRNLDYLGIINTELSNLPDTIGNLINLNCLLIYKNKLSEFPDSICFLHNLEEIQAYENLFKEAPTRLLNLPKLKFLDLNNNLIDYLPEELASLNNWNNLYPEVN